MTASDAFATNRFWTKVDWTQVRDQDACWIWTAALCQGYGYIAHLGRPRFAHRLAYENLVGPIPAGLQLDHLCRERRCVNPDHLEPVTTQENTRRGMNLTAVNSRKTECVNGHSLADPYVHRGKRHCRVCRRDAARRLRATRREQLVPGDYADGAA